VSTERFGPEHADCHTCELHPRCHGRKTRAVPGVPAAHDPCGLMVIGEGPGKHEVVRGVPFAGPAGDVLNDMLQAAGFDRETVHVTNATLGQPPPKEGSGKQGLHGRFPKAIYSCLPRLERELEAWRPRIVVTMGAAALITATGYTQKKNKHVPLLCEHCDPKTRKVGPAVACAVGDCDFVWTALGHTDADAAELWDAEKERLGGKCPLCTANVKRIKVRMVKCPHCKGKKKHVVVEDIFKHDNLALVGKNGIAGALFAAADLPSRWDAFGVEYVICTLHPAFCLHSSGAEQGFGGQFAAQAVLDHLEKAKRLLARPPNWHLSVRLTDDADEVLAYFEGHESEAIYDADIETDAKSPWDVSVIRCIGFGRPDVDEVLVVDTRRMIQVTVIDPNEGKEENAPTEPLRYEIEILDPELLSALRGALLFPTGWQNASYDAICIWRLWGIILENIAADTKVAHHSLRPDEPHTLAHIGAGMTDTLAWKEPKKLKDVQQWDNFTQLVTYNAKDVRNTSYARERMVGRLCRRIEQRRATQ
jgi:uracil-DNA glycosylase family 4